MPAYYTIQFRFDRFLLKEDEACAKTKWSGIINLYLVVLVDNTRGHFTHCSHCFTTREITARIIYENTEYGVFTVLITNSRVRMCLVIFFFISCPTSPSGIVVTNQQTTFEAALIKKSLLTQDTRANDASKARLHVRFFVQRLSHFSAQFLSRSSSAQ